MKKNVSIFSTLSLLFFFCVPTLAGAVTYSPADALATLADQGKLTGSINVTGGNCDEDLYSYDYFSFELAEVNAKKIKSAHIYFSNAYWYGIKGSIRKKSGKDFYVIKIKGKDTDGSITYTGRVKKDDPTYTSNEKITIKNFKGEGCKVTAGIQ